MASVNDGGANDVGFFYESQKSIDLVNQQNDGVEHKVVSNEVQSLEPEARILVLYTGGTIGMRVNPNGGEYELSSSTCRLTVSQIHLGLPMPLAIILFNRII